MGYNGAARVATRKAAVSRDDIARGGVHGPRAVESKDACEEASGLDWKVGALTHDAFGMPGALVVATSGGVVTDAGTTVLLDAKATHGAAKSFAISGVELCQSAADRRAPSNGAFLLGFIPRILDGLGLLRILSLACDGRNEVTIPVRVFGTEGGERLGALGLIV